MRIRTGAAVAAAVAAVVGVSGVAVASSGSPSPVGVKPSMAASPAPNLFDANAVAVLAAQLGISTDQARHVLDQIQRLAARGGAKGGIDPFDPAFVAIARGAGVTAQQLASALDQVKGA